MAAVFYIKQGDTMPSLEAVLKDASGSAVNLSAADSVYFHLQLGSVSISRAAVVVTPAVGSVRFDWQASDIVTAGNGFGEFQVNWADGTVTTFPNNDSIWVLITAQVG